MDFLIVTTAVLQDILTQVGAAQQTSFATGLSPATHPTMAGLKLRPSTAGRLAPAVHDRFCTVLRGDFHSLNLSGPR